ncbi:non-ribosomal peptide synthetase [Streptomyces tendae]|uniref:Amino acid adenylation domain-containing protein n=1 Tax=Streptomyces tendae TaxID=1932 RepID=A0ABX6A0M4_STRTE|nr:non-ribosomal peptide synthetase [Streptomyces tendae]QER90431.1 amino acid adenylation domain-containing protein [Streptomyces tendae]
MTDTNTAELETGVTRTGAERMRARLEDLSEEQRALLEQRLRERRHRLRAQEPLVCETSVAQQGLWFLDQLKQDDPFYTLAWRIDLAGPLDVGALSAAVNDVVARHGALRTRFAERDGRPVQVVEPFRGLRVPVTDLRRPDGPTRDTVVDAACARLTSEAFDLAKGPLFRVEVLRVADDRHVLVVLVHHIVFDGRSMDIVVRELAEAYNTVCAGRPLPVRPAEQYADFAAWQRRHLSGERTNQLLDFWREELRDAPELLSLPISRPRPAEQSYAGAERRMRLPAPVSASLHALARAERSTLFMTVLAALQLLLMRYSGRPDVSVGTPVGGRLHTAFEQSVGYFVNTVVLRGRLEGDPTFRTFLRQTRRTFLTAYDHQDLPFDRLVEALRPQRSLGRNPLYQVTLSHEEDRSGQRPRFAGLETAHLGIVDVARSKFDLSFTAAQDGDEVEIAVEYATDLFDTDSVEGLMGHLRRLLEAVTADPDEPVSRLMARMVSEEERGQLDRWARTPGSPDAGTVLELVAAQVAAAPQAVALVAGDRTVTYADLDRMSDRIASGLADADVRPGSLVAVAAGRSVELVAALLGVWKHGCAYLPLDTAGPAARATAIVADAHADAVVSMEHEGSSRWPVGVQVVPLTSLMAAGDPSPRTTPPTAGPDDLAYVLYTSGSTGAPKGVEVSHGGLAGYVRWAAAEYCPASTPTAPLHTAVGVDLTVTSLWLPLASGGTVHVIDESGSVPELARTLTGGAGCDLVKLTPTQLDELCRLLPSGALAGRDVCFVIGGEVLAADLVRRLFDIAPDARAVNEYGPTEAVVGCCTLSLTADDTPDDRPTVPIGRPTAGAELRVLDPHGLPVPTGTPGELCIGGSVLARGYVRDPVRTAAVFVPDPYAARPGSRLYRTGDLVRHLGDGRLEFLGRSDRQLKIGHERIEPAEVEAALRAVHGVRTAAVQAHRGDGGREHLVGYVTGEVTATSVRDAVAELLPEPMVPASIMVLDTLPRTEDGTVDQAALPVPDGLRASGTVTVTPADPVVQQVVATLWALILACGTMGPNEDFFARGGQSLSAVRAVGLIREVFQLDVPVAALFQSPTPALFAARLGELAGDRVDLAEAAASVQAVLKLSDQEVTDRLTSPE